MFLYNLFRIYDYFDNPVVVVVASATSERGVFLGRAR